MAKRKIKLNWAQRQSLKDILIGLQGYEFHDRRTLKALQRRGLVRFHKQAVALTKAGRVAVEQCRQWPAPTTVTVSL